MSDLHLTELGDIALSSEGDIAMVDSPWRSHSQQAYIRMKTAIGDYLLYPNLGADLEKLIGYPQSESTGEYGKMLIYRALTRDSVLASLPIDIKAVPVSYQAIRFDIYITAGRRTELVLSITQDLGAEDSLVEEIEPPTVPNLVDGGFSGSSFDLIYDGGPADNEIFELELDGGTS